MRLLKPHRWYGDIMSENTTIVRLFDFQVTAQEFLNPHWVEFMYLKRDKEIGSYILKKWKRIPLNRYAYSINKLCKLDGERERLKAHLDKISNNKNKREDDNNGR